MFGTPFKSAQEGTDQQKGPPVVPFYPFLGEGSPTKIDYRGPGHQKDTPGGFFYLKFPDGDALAAKTLELSKDFFRLPKLEKAMPELWERSLLLSK